jgi:putative dimethyl sulfoxide reductase chaperone
MPATEPNPVDTAAIVEAKQANDTRAAMYRFLSRAFKMEVDQRFLDSALAMLPTIKSLGDSQSSKELEQGSRELFDFTERIKSLDDEQKKKSLQDLAVEYAGLFLGVGTKHVYLVESVYLGKEHLLYEAPYHEVLEAYRSLGFTKEKDFPEPEDHVAVEFEFMSNLCNWTSQTIQKRDATTALAYLNLQNEFLRDHILRWIPDLCNKLDEAATTDFYKMLAHLTIGFVTIDNEIPDHMTEILKSAFSVEIKKMKIAKDSSVTYYS